MPKDVCREEDPACLNRELELEPGDEREVSDLWKKEQLGMKRTCDCKIMQREH